MSCLWFPTHFKTSINFIIGLSKLAFGRGQDYIDLKCKGDRTAMTLKESAVDRNMLRQLFWLLYLHHHRRLEWVECVQWEPWGPWRPCSIFWTRPTCEPPQSPHRCPAQGHMLGPPIPAGRVKCVSLVLYYVFVDFWLEQQLYVLMHQKM